MNNLEWNVYIYDFNNKKIKPYNIFYKDSIQEIISEVLKGRPLKNAILSWAKYNYWSQTEYEILVGGLFDTLNSFEKIDIYNQIEINIDRITEYIYDKLCNVNGDDFYEN